MIFKGEERKKILRELLGRNKPRRETEMQVAKPDLWVLASGGDAEQLRDVKEKTVRDWRRL
jgi:hypothetical protein